MWKIVGSVLCSLLGTRVTDTLEVGARNAGAAEPEMAKVMAAWPGLAPPVKENVVEDDPAGICVVRKAKQKREMLVER